MTLEIAGKVQKRFVQDAVLLYKLDPVRGSPTTYGLDRHPHDADGSREVLLKRKFLDSIALLASTHKNAARVSAATLEIGAPEGTVVRIASNAGVCDTTLLLLRDLISDLHDVSNRGLTTERRIDVLMKIIRIDVEKIRYYFDKLHRVQSEVPDIMNTLLLLSSEPAFADAQQFSAWMENLSAVTAVATGASAVQLLPHILWAEKAKWEYSTYIEAIFSAQGSQLPWWIYHIYKLGRYAVASRALCQLPAEYPGLFCPMRIEPIHSPPRLDFSIPPHERPLSEVLRRIVGDREDEFATRLASVWGATNPESYFRKASHLRLAVHAEMQLVGFYDQHPELIPSFRFIGEPSWQMLVDLLGSDDQFGVRFNKEREFFVVNDALWVRNERQFLACLQFLRNSSCCNAEVQVRTKATEFYAVYAGRVDEPTIYSSWADAHPRVTGYSAAVFKSFSSLQKALDYMKDRGAPAPRRVIKEGASTARNPWCLLEALDQGMRPKDMSLDVSVLFDWDQNDTESHDEAFGLDFEALSIQATKTEQ
ncbi:hypothetical protein CGGC5_v011024 [Colletotrichum fructicola Nara gc5]|uniref:Ribonuclease H1 N-terminal domain-containing protein n=1 Tax=Colletotrichum fructicola (strain Nara gc5) TaxID=1213859 RepID=A0A7J6ITU4_COLFN|nr:hypothetical protein CGGC5_v011024 [Colletotrichum fructicola Nara gc5]